MSLTESLLQGGWAHVKVDPVKLRFIGVLAGDWGISHAAINSSTAMGIWLLDEGDGDTAYDSSGNGNHGKISGAAWAGGMFGSALSFDGADDFVDCGNSELLRIGTGSMAAWINTNVDDNSGLSAVTLPFDDGDACDAPWRSLGLGTWQGQLQYWIAINDQNREIQPGQIEVDRWYHQAITFDGESRKAYLDGELVEEVKGAGEITYGRPVPTAVIGSASVVVKRESCSTVSWMRSRYSMSQ